MARVPCKHVLIVFIFLCFISTTPTARSLPDARETKEGLDGQVVTGTESGAPPDVDELVAVDYTPARRKPPIHN
ncbi:root meristem growth factor 9, GOLVEN 2, CLE-like 9 [Hibiscus trionum]|uniref:Root meristem growth factor 9, GOLVEN 2, CLE-like 9 n=1 Tax=Hibiscus trionum TaxID=183268 RepID=A0A9W7J4U8_HIBTR|nr:root meristem growth factor 9, GOLVEN 2, CLE-like 9 [Hibiscus trionum]